MFDPTGDSRDLFDDRPTNEAEIPDTLDRRIYVFLNRCHPLIHRELVERELRELIAWAQVNP